MHTKATMCRNKNFKYIKRAYEKDEFYDLKQDPGEIKNLIDKNQINSTDTFGISSVGNYKLGEASLSYSGIMIKINF